MAKKVFVVAIMLAFVFAIVGAIGLFHCRWNPVDSGVIRSGVCKPLWPVLSLLVMLPIFVVFVIPGLVHHVFPAFVVILLISLVQWLALAVIFYGLWKLFKPKPPPTDVT